jgi:hypothetical protein
MPVFIVNGAKDVQVDRSSTRRLEQAFRGAARRHAPHLA